MSSPRDFDPQDPARDSLAEAEAKQQETAEKAATAREQTAPQPAGTAGSAETRERLLDSAERLFAERGFEGTSMRAITQGAGTSVSAANYHFGSKEKLLHETLRRAAAPANDRRLELLDRYEALAAGSPLELERLLDAFLRPVIEWRNESRKKQQGVEAVRQISARLFSDPPELIQSVKIEIFGPMSLRFLAALQRALPAHTADEIDLSYQFLIGIMVYVISGQLDSSSWAARHRGDIDEDALLEHMIRFTAAGLRAGPAAPVTPAT